MKSKVADNVYWVGVVSWDCTEAGTSLTRFHHSKSYNSYLIHEKTAVLVDTVAPEFAGQFINNLKMEIRLKDLKYIVLNSCKDDHIGALPLLLQENPGIVILTAARWVGKLKKILPENSRIIGIQSGDSLDLGKHKLDYFEVRRQGRSNDVFWSFNKVLFSEYASEFFMDDLFRDSRKNRKGSRSPFQDVQGSLKKRLGISVPMNVLCTNHGTPIFL